MKNVDIKINSTVVRNSFFGVFIDMNLSFSDKVNSLIHQINIREK